MSAQQPKALPVAPQSRQEVDAECSVEHNGEEAKDRDEDADHQDRLHGPIALLGWSLPLAVQDAACGEEEDEKDAPVGSQTEGGGSQTTAVGSGQSSRKEPSSSSAQLTAVTSVVGHSSEAVSSQ